MNLADLRAELEANQAWRRDEIRFFQNQLTWINAEEKQSQFRRALVLILYAHFEGFCKFALQAYAAEINRSGLKCKNATPQIAASAWADVFDALEDWDRKNRVFARALPHDEFLHKFARRA